MEVGVHYYDLTEGMCSRYGRPLIDPLPGDPEASTAAATNDAALQSNKKREGKVGPGKGLSCSCAVEGRSSPATTLVNPAAHNHNIEDEELFIHPRFSVMHSSVVCFGFEYYFEGGIGRAPRGCTRFGPMYEYVTVHLSAKKTQDEFEAWLREVTHKQYGFPMYSASEHNCHQFTDAALKFLTGDECGIPAHIWENVTRIVRSPLLRAFVPLSSRLVCGSLRQSCRPIQAHLLEMGHGVLRLRKAAELANVDTIPSKTVFLFGCSTAQHAEKTLKLGLIGCVDIDTDPEPPSVSETMSIKKLIIQITQGGPGAVTDPDCIVDTLTSLGKIMDHRHSHMITEPLNALRLLVLHDSLLSYALADPRLSTIIMRVVRDYADLPGECKVALIRLIANYASGPQGCKMLIADVRSQHWLYIAGAALLDVDPTITFHGSCLLYNLALSVAVMTNNSVENVFNCTNASHIDNLVTVALYHLSSRRSTDAVFLRILMALLVLCEASPSIAIAINNHTISPNINELLAAYSSSSSSSSPASSSPTTNKGADAGSNGSQIAAAAEVVEIRSLLCLFNAVLFMAEGGDEDEAEEKETVNQRRAEEANKE